jgi:hypothetical protein
MVIAEEITINTKGVHCQISIITIAILAQNGSPSHNGPDKLKNESRWLLIGPAVSLNYSRHKVPIATGATTIGSTSRALDTCKNRDLPEAINAKKVPNNNCIGTVKTVKKTVNCMDSTNAGSESAFWKLVNPTKP